MFDNKSRIVYVHFYTNIVNYITVKLYKKTMILIFHKYFKFNNIFVKSKISKY